ncbi:DUF3226 domain-containing protein [Thiomicrospira microaerophila]|uniref:DUF3226 domain-containing protein n=1 Tax=Thiomicrospira microaerophila TaxID=406020 RepID=UPI0005CA3047|nr:DUF3226 domain-containing protein [Thiomicrospira microaerophila]
MNNLLIVESDSDRLFLEVLISHLNLSVEVGKPICLVEDFECLEGLSERNITLKLQNEKLDKYDKVGILVDADSEGIANRVELVRRAILAAGATSAPECMNERVLCPEFEVEFAIGVMHLNGFGELETVLKEIKAQPSPYADCLNAWKACLDEQGQSIKQKDFDKFWLNNYFRYDTCSLAERGQAGKKCSKAAAFKKEGIWNFEHEALDDLKFFLKLFG